MLYSLKLTGISCRGLKNTKTGPILFEQDLWETVCRVWGPCCLLFGKEFG